MTSMAVTGEVVEQPALLHTIPETIYVRETATGLIFGSDTPIEVWGGLVERLQRQQKLIEWALADAIIFGEQAYGEIHAQWVDETGLSKRTLQNIARIGRAIPPARRRADVSFSHHAEVASLPVPDQESLLDRAESAGMTRYDLRDAVRARKVEIAGRAVDANGTPIEEPEPLAWVPQLGDLAPAARAELEQRLFAIGKRHRLGYTAGWLQALVYLGEESAFLPGRWRL